MNAEIESLTRVSPMKALYKKHEHISTFTCDKKKREEFFSMSL